MNHNEIIIDDYTLGLLYGDGHFMYKDKLEVFQFSTTHKELALHVIKKLDENNVSYSNYTRDHNSEDKEKWELLEIVEIYNKDFRDYLKVRGFNSERPDIRIVWNSNFICGYLETSGTIFSYTQRGNELWNMVFSGDIEDMFYISERMNKMGVKHSTVKKHEIRERVSRGVITNCYRVPIQNRDGIAKMISFIEKSNNMSEVLRQRIDKFNHFHTTKPFNMKRKVFKHYKYAVAYMSRTLGLELKGERGGTVGGSGAKPIYLWDNGEKTKQFNGWKGAYEWICKEFNNKTGFDAPKVNDQI